MKSILPRFLIIAGVTLACFAVLHTAAAAQTTAPATPSPFTAGDSADWASAWINYLFRGEDLPGAMAGYGARLAPMAEGLRKALGLYSMGMLILAGILLFYHITSAIVNTAHDGVALGRRANQTWAPIRLVVAIALLVPVGSGLSAGQYIVIKIAEEGSSLASNAWRTVIGSMGGNFSSLVTPATPNVAALAATATEMEICRLTYQQMYAPALTSQDSPLRLAGPIGDMLRTPAGHIVDETWFYSNTINVSTPLCGAYRFPGYRRHGTAVTIDNVARMADDLALFSHAETESIISQARPIAAHAASVFSETEMPSGFSIQYDLGGLEKAIRADLTTHLQKMDSVNSMLTEGVLTGPGEAGWVGAVVFIPEFIRLQESYGELVSHMLPEASGPIFAHPALAQRVLGDAIMATPSMSALDRSTADALFHFYAQVSAPTSLAHAWIYANQLGDNDYVPPTGLDIHDQMNAAIEPQAAFGLFARALDTAAISNGVWGVDGSQLDSGNPFAAPSSAASYNPLTAGIEYGRRQYNLGLYLSGIAGSALSSAMATAPAALTGLVGLAFLLGGLVLIFLVPIVPFLRFLFAILAWLLDLFEAIAAMPVVALAHLTPMGEGLSGGAARQAYLLWIGLLIRPILSLFGLVLGFLIFAIGMAFLGIVLGPFAHLAAATNSGVLIVANTGLVLLYDVLAYVIANAAFRGIYLLPDQALRWISPFMVTEHDAQQPAAAGGNISAIPVLTQIEGVSRREAITNGSSSGGTSNYGVRSQNALFPIQTIEKHTDMSPGNAANVTETQQGDTTNVTSSSVTSTSSATSSSVTHTGNEGSASASPSSGAGGKSPRFSNVPFFQNKDKPNS